MSDLSDVASGVAPVSENAAETPASGTASGAEQTKISDAAEDVDRSGVGEEARERFGGNLRAAKENINRLADEQKTAGAQRMRELARAVHGAANNLEPGLPQAAKPLHDAAAALERASAALKERSVVDLMDGVGKFARAQPVAFFGGTVLAGLVLARFLKSSAAPRPTATDDE